MKRTPNTDEGIQNLVQRLDLALNSQTARIVTFISARPGEGTSTIARDYAAALADSVDHNILLIDAGKLDRAYFHDHDADPEITIADTVAGGRPVTEALYPLGPHVFLARWSGQGRSRGVAGKLINDAGFWAALHEKFGTVVIDAPSLKESSDGIALAVRADATVLVVEAETTRQPVIENLRDTVGTAGAKIVGIVMNKRRYYIPAKVYQNM
jgi:Mrp family chromosome partitioning ATPase